MLTQFIIQTYSPEFLEKQPLLHSNLQPSQQKPMVNILHYLGCSFFNSIMCANVTSQTVLYLQAMLNIYNKLHEFKPLHRPENKYMSTKVIKMHGPLQYIRNNGDGFTLVRPVHLEQFHAKRESRSFMYT